jgi:dTMP kinase
MLIAIEGIDGSGKGTQTAMLSEALRSNGARVAVLQFPRYADTFFGHEIGLYLNGEFGDLMSVSPKLGALLYAGDRLESRNFVRDLLDRNDYVVCDRYTPSNQAHHAAKLPQTEWARFFTWVEQLEYDVYSIPRPDLSVFLDIEADVAAKLVLRKPKRTYTSRSADIHEVSIDYQSNVHQAYAALAKGKNWAKVQCSRDGTLRSQEEIARDLYEIVTQMSSKMPQFARV